MTPIHFQGLNCYHDCVISIANFMGMDYPAAFATLWSEFDFHYDTEREAFLTKRLLKNLETMGAKVEDSSHRIQKAFTADLSLFNKEEFIIVGMDAFYIPWNDFYNSLHGPHYFIAQNIENEILPCTDPTYNKANEQILRDKITQYAFDICRVNLITKKAPKINIVQEAQEIIRIHPETRSKLLARVNSCVKEERENIILLAKYIDAMINNRYLYRFFLQNQPLAFYKNDLFLNQDFITEWKAVKNGLYKASIANDNKTTVEEVARHLNFLIDSEIKMAETMSLR